MNNSDKYDYQELAYDLYKEGDDLLESLVRLRDKRGMTQDDLAQKMNVSQGYISKIENGNTNMVSLLTDYALEVGARLHFVVEPAEEYSEGVRSYRTITHISDATNTLIVWDDDSIAIDTAKKETTFTIQSSSKNNILYIQDLSDIEEKTASVESEGESEKILSSVGGSEYANW